MSPQCSIPINTIPPGSTLFVAGSPRRKVRDLVLTLILSGCTSDDQLLFTTTDTTSEDLLTQCEKLHQDVDFTTVDVIDVTDSTDGDLRFDAHVESVSTPGNLTELGIKFSIMFENSIHESSGNVLTTFITVSTLLDHADLRPIIRFLKTASGRIESAKGVGFFIIDPSVHDDRTVSTLRAVGDGWIEVREPGEATSELRVRGLPKQPENWVSFTIPDPVT